MSIDMSQFYQVFFDEAAEHLVSMEALLLGLNLDAPDPDQLNAIFRAAHSIKGGSGTFGFTDMADVTHVLETLLDRVRKNEIPLTHDMVDAFLQAGDVLRGLLEAHQHGTNADETRSTEICAKLEKLADHPNAGRGKKAEGKGPRTAATGSSRAPAQHIYQIQFANTQAAFPDETHLNNLLEELGNVGMISNRDITADTVKMTLDTQASATKLREIFAFFLEPEQLSITELGSVPDHDTMQGYGFFADPAAIKSSAENAEGYGFFADPETIKSGVENAEGYGFFAAPEAIKSGVENARGYGFFNEVGNHASTPGPALAERQDQNPGRRATDRAAAAGGESSIRVSVGKVDNLVNLVGELVITQAMLAETASNMDSVLYERLINGLGQLERNTRDLQESVMSVRMIPISLVFSRFQRVVRDSAVKLNKKVQLKIIGEGTELDKGLIEKISDPLTHLVRNSLDHGIELPDERIAKGKDPQGTITLRAAHQGGSIVIEVSDDGAGLNRELILAKAREKGMPVSDSMSDAEIWQIIFAPGFSTAKVVTDVSGRGVGMDVVKKNIESISGRIEISSVLGQGTSMTIRLPLTLAILDGLSIAVGDQIYIVPLGFISESLQPDPGDIKEISGQGEVVHVRGEYLPLIALHKLFNIQPKITNPAEGILVLLEAEGKKVALFVDELVGQHQVVIKSLETNYRKVPGVSGATIMGDGRVAMIIDVGALVKLAQQKQS
ncbi:MAG TPA: chemotaxis protein CheW [Gallionella sp.]|nr:chemotaxis protein CheW [Gallionella sp.]